jgi:choline dehydrogenase-like flavoprotein
MRARPADFARWAKRGIEGWSWERVLGAYKALENKPTGRHRVRTARRLAQRQNRGLVRRGRQAVRLEDKVSGRQEICRLRGAIRGFSFGGAREKKRNLR